MFSKIKRGLSSFFRAVKNVFKGQQDSGASGTSLPDRATPAPVVIVDDAPTEYPEGWIDKALKITGQYEGRGFDQVTGNFDGQGLSAGILQWCYGQGSLQSKILKPFISLYGKAELNKFFNADVAASVYYSASAGVGFAKRYNGGWESSWRAFLLDERTVKLQKIAAREVAEKAWRYCQQWSLPTERAFCFFFDVVTQNGSMKGMKPPSTIESFKASIQEDGGINKSYWYELNPTDEQLILWQSIRDRVVRNRWASDVLARKGTIIFGIGKVHGKLINITFEG